MLFQSLDNKSECYAIVCSGDLHHYPNSMELTKTWQYAKHLRGQDIEYAQIWCDGKSLKDVCPDNLKEELNYVLSKGKAFLNCFNKAKINLDDICFYDSVPKKYLLELCRIKDSISEHVFNTYTKPMNYEFMKNLIELVEDIKTRRLNIDTNKLNTNAKDKAIFNKKISNTIPYICYDPYGTNTGRLSTKTGSFPIMTIKKENRAALKPNNDWFLELDFNAAELRALLYLYGKQQPDGDIHSWICEDVFDSKITREKTKTRVFSWLYNPKSKNKKLSQFIDKNTILDKYYKNGVVLTPYGRHMRVEPAKALNYLLQSVSSDLFLTQAHKIFTMLQGRKSYISICMHDGLVIDYSEDDSDLLADMKAVFADTDFGQYKVNVSVGKDYYNMQELK